MPAEIIQFMSVQSIIVVFTSLTMVVTTGLYVVIQYAQAASSSDIPCAVCSAIDKLKQKAQDIQNNARIPESAKNQISTQLNAGEDLLAGYPYPNIIPLTGLN